jgi:hypothetical protein
MIHKDLPEFHKEYQKVYKDYTVEFNILQEAYLHVKYTPTQVNSLNNTYYEEKSLNERYGPAYQQEGEGKDKLTKFMLHANPGDIINDNWIEPRPYKQVYKCIQDVG